MFQNLQNTGLDMVVQKNTIFNQMKTKVERKSLFTPKFVALFVSALANWPYSSFPEFLKKSLIFKFEFRTLYSQELK